MQGAELQVLRGMKALLRRPALHTAVVEVSGTELYSGQALQGEVVAFMRGHGFHCVQSCECEFHCDTLFSRPPVQPPPRLPTRCVSKECIARQQQQHDVASHTSKAAMLAAVEAEAAEKARSPDSQAMVVTPAAGSTEPPSREDIADNSAPNPFPWLTCRDGACAVVSVFTGGVADEWRNLYATLRPLGLHQMAEQPDKTVHSSCQGGRRQAKALSRA